MTNHGDRNFLLEGICTCPIIRPNHFEMPWEDIKQTYSGIIITPHIYERHLTLAYGWYNLWDCASGCIWDISAIESITLRQ